MPRSTHKDPLARKASMLVEFLLDKYTKKETITQNALLKVISRKYRQQHFPEILRRASECMELVFGLELKEVDHSRNIYVLISKLSLGGDEGPSDEKGPPKSSLLMALLGFIFMKGNQATKEVWEFLSVFGVYAGRKHLIFGEPRRLITKELVQKRPQKILTNRKKWRKMSLSCCLPYFF
uniref:MAGE domain-containing protein n=1 Tax=Bos indicus x Bos taurus TaxID=30522 RepID=A0A4W2GLI2_BOBOX